MSCAENELKVIRVKLTNDKSVAVDQDYFWRPLHTCPLSAKVQLLTTGGVAVYGQYTPAATGYLGWAPLPKKPSWMEGSTPHGY